MEEQCDHHWVTDVQLGRYYECEICGMIFLKKEWGRADLKEKQNNLTDK